MNLGQKFPETVVAQDAVSTRCAEDRPTKIAVIQLHPARFSIAGPTALVVATQAIIDARRGLDEEETKYYIHDLWEDWFLQCSVSGEWFRLSDLRYWDVDTGKLYLKPELVPQPTWEESRESFESRMHALLDQHRAAPNNRKRR